MWKAFGVGPGKLLPWRDINRCNQSDTHIKICEGYDFFSSSSRTVKGKSETSSVTATVQISGVLLFQCSDVSCSQSFTDIESAELHICLESHSNSNQEWKEEKKQGNIYDSFRLNWVEQFASLTVTTHPSPKVAAAQEFTEEEDVALSSGWVLQN